MKIYNKKTLYMVREVRTFNEAAAFLHCTRVNICAKSSVILDGVRSACKHYIVDDRKPAARAYIKAQKLIRCLDNIEFSGIASNIIEEAYNKMETQII